MATVADDAVVTAPPGRHRSWAALALVTPALVVVAVFFVVPLLLSAVGAFRAADGGFTLAHFEKSLELYTRDLMFTLGIVALSTVLIAVVAIAIAGYLTLGENPRAVAVLRWLYRWPLFIPFVVAGQVMRTFLAKNGLLNHVLIGTGLIEPIAAQSVLDWRGIVVAFVWKQAPFVTLLLALCLAGVTLLGFRCARAPIATGFQTFASPQSHPIVLSPNGANLYVANTTSNSVSVISTASAAVVAEIGVGIEPVGLAVRPDGRELWVANHVSDSVSVIDLDPASPRFHSVIATIQDIDPAGVTHFDSSVGGLGGCPYAPRATGNVATEDLVYLLEGEGLVTGVDLDALVRVAEWLEGMLGRRLEGYVYRAGGFPAPTTPASASSSTSVSE